jgi:hypothetical protein
VTTLQKWCAAGVIGWAVIEVCAAVSVLAVLVVT